MRQGMRRWRRIQQAVAAMCTVLACTAFGIAPALAQATLAAVKKRGEIRCGVNGQLPGFSVRDAKGWWVGFEIDFCRAIAAGVLGDAGRVQFVALTTQTRFEALRSGKVDVLARNTMATLGRVAGTGVRDAVVIYIDGQSVVVPKKSNIVELARLEKHTVCILSNTPTRSAWRTGSPCARSRSPPVMFATQEAMYAAFFNGTLRWCDSGHLGARLDGHRQRQGDRLPDAT